MKTKRVALMAASILIGTAAYGAGDFIGRTYRATVDTAFKSNVPTNGGRDVQAGTTARVTSRL